MIKYKPILKWTGSKYGEYDDIKNYLPKEINDYYEPFAGGLGLMYRLLDNGLINGDIFANDISTELISFYRNVNNDNLINELWKISNCWDYVRLLGENLFKNHKYEFIRIVKHDADNDIFINDGLKSEIDNFLSKEDSPFNNFNLHNFSLVAKIYDGLADKVNRFIKKDLKENEDFEKVAKLAITTSVCQSYYFVIRDMYNDWLSTDTKDYTVEEKCAEWYFVRQFAYGGMFRFSKDGRFNVPYGGYGYNSRCFSCYIDLLTSKEIKETFNRLHLNCGDYSDFLNKDFNENDFIFLDPPYDSTFSEYEGNTFDKDEQIRLRDYLTNLKCKWMMVIKKTDFIYNLYKDFKITEYDKKYKYHARGDYDKNVKHLIITNYDN